MVHPRSAHPSRPPLPRTPCRLLLLVLGLFPFAVPALSAQEFWSHRYVVVHDVPYGDDEAQQADLYLHGDRVGEPDYFRRDEGPRPTLLFIHGGGWVAGDKRGQDPLFMHFVQRGWNVANINYRQGPDTDPLAVEDALCALAWLVENADEYGVDRQRVVVSGASAGGHLTLTTGILGSRPGHRCSPGDGFRVAAMVNWFGITDIASVEAYLAENRPQGNYARAWIGHPDEVASVSARWSPIHLVDAEAPPVLTVHGDADTVVPHDQATTFHAKLDELGVENRLVTLEGGNHSGFTDAQYREAFAAIFAFLDGALAAD